MKSAIASLIKPFANLCYQFVYSISPDWALVIYILVLIILGVWVLTLTGEKPVNGRNILSILVSDLRFWALGIISIQILIYIVFE